MRRSPSDKRKMQSAAMLMLSDMVRAVAVTAAGVSEWIAKGYEFGGEDETFNGVEDYSHSNIYARPVGADAVVVCVGGSSDVTCAVGIKDEAARNAMIENFGDISEGEVAIYPQNASSRIVMKTDGTVVIEGNGLTSDSLLKRSEFMALFNAHVHLGVSPGTGLSGTPDNLTKANDINLVGTETLKSS